MVKIEKGNFTTIYNDIFRAELDSKKLTPEAWGIYIFMLSLPNDWDYTIEGLTKVINAGKNKIGRVLKELENTGFLIREQLKDELGKFSKTVYTVLRRSEDEITKEPLPRNPSTGYPSTGNEPQQNTKELNTNITNTIYTNESIDNNIDTIAAQESVFSLSLIKQKVKNLNLKKIKPKTFFNYYQFENWKTKNGKQITLNNVDSLLQLWDSREYENTSKEIHNNNGEPNKPSWINRYMDELDSMKPVNEL